MFAPNRTEFNSIHSKIIFRFKSAPRSDVPLEKRNIKRCYYCIIYVLLLGVRFVWMKKHDIIMRNTLFGLDLN